MVDITNRRIIVIDDQASIHDDFRRIMQCKVDTGALDDVAAAFLGTPSRRSAVAQARSNTRESRSSSGDSRSGAKSDGGWISFTRPSRDSNRDTAGRIDSAK